MPYNPLMPAFKASNLTIQVKLCMHTTIVSGDNYIFLVLCASVKSILFPPEIEIEVLDQYEVMSDTGRVRSVSGPDNEKIEILADALGVFNFTGMFPHTTEC